MDKEISEINKSKITKITSFVLSRYKRMTLEYKHFMEV